MAWLESLGEGVVLAWLGLALLARAVRARPEHAPESTYRRALAALSLAQVSLVLPWLREALPSVPAVAGPVSLSLRVLASTADEGFGPVRGLAVSPLSLLAGAWIVVTALASLRLIAAWLGLRRLLSQAMQAPAAEHATLDEELLRVATRPPRLLVSEEAASPFSVGTWRPAIVLPSVVVATLDDSALRLVLRHELLHLQRRDPLSHALSRLLALAFTGHPSLPGLQRQLSLSREAAVDRRAAAADAAGYARILLRLAELSRFGVGATQVAMDDTALSRRIALLALDAPRQAAPPWLPLGALSLMVAAWIWAPRIVPDSGPRHPPPFMRAFAGPGEPFGARDELPRGFGLPEQDPLAAYQAEISACYELARREQADLVVDTFARFSLEPLTFAVIDVDLSRTPSPVFARCLGERAKHWRFPPPPEARLLTPPPGADAEAIVAVQIQRRP